MTEKEKNNNTTTPPATRPTLHIDVAEFEHFLAECEGTDEEKRQYLELIWQIVSEFVALGFGVHPIQQACDDDVTETNIITDEALAMLPSQDTEPHTDTKGDLTDA